MKRKIWKEKIGNITFSATNENKLTLKEKMIITAIFILGIIVIILSIPQIW